MAATPPHRWIELEGAVNARAVVPGVLLRADNLQALTEADVRRLVDEHRLEVVVDLRTDIEVGLEGPGPLTEQPGVRIEYRSLYPDSGRAGDVDVAPIQPWGSVFASSFADETPVVRAYMGYLEQRPDSIVAAARAIACAAGATLVHCAAGKDRTGVVVALTLDAAGVDRPRILGDYMATGERIEAIIDRLVRSPTYRAELVGHSPYEHAPAAETMERVLELVGSRFGGSAAWLTAHGLERHVLERLRRRIATLADH
jgi:protein-tyrosine phosphatase